MCFVSDIPISAILMQQKLVMCGVQVMWMALGALTLSKRCGRLSSDISLVAEVAGGGLWWRKWWLTFCDLAADLRIDADYKIESH